MLSTVVFLSMVGLGFGVTQPVEGQVSLVGILELNRELSDEPRLRPERPKRDRNRLGGRGWGNRGQPPEILAERRAGVRAAILDLMTPAHRLRITGTRDEMIMRCQDGRVVRFLPDGRQHAGIAGSSVRVTRTSEWDGKALVANIELEDSMGFELEEICQVRNGESGRQLIVVSRFRGGPFRNAGENVQRVYNAEEISR